MEDNVKVTPETDLEVTSSETKSNDTEKISANDYKIIIDMVKEVDGQYKSLKETLDSMVENTYGLKPEVLEMILPYGKDEIPTLSENEIKEFLNKYITKPEYSFDEKDRETLVETMTTIKEASLVLLSTKAEADEIKNSSTDVLQEYFNYMTSDKVKKSREKRLESMKKALELETNEMEKIKIQKMINVIESTLNFSFVKTRFDELGDSELESIKKAYFDKNRGSYIIQKYKNKIGKFGYNEDIYKYFFNIEENFLASKYSPFNNLFLFIYMRMVAYSDPYNKDDKMMVQALTGALANLIYHKFDSLEGEQFFIQVISEVLDKFIENEKFDYVSYFKENNTTYEEHPARKAAEAHHEQHRKESLIRMLTELKISNFDESMTADELQEIYNRETELMIKNQIGEESEDEELEIEEAEEVDVVDLKPSINVEESNEDELENSVENKPIETAVVMTDFI